MATNGEHHAAGRRALRRRLRRAGLVLGALLAAVTLVFALADAPGTFALARGEGRPGTFVAQERSCSHWRFAGTTCQWRGTFTPDGGPPVEVTLRVDGPPDVPGDRVAAVRVREGDDVVWLAGDSGPRWALLGSIPVLAAILASYLLRRGERG